MTYKNDSVTQTVDTKLIDRLIQQSATTEDDLNRGRTGNIDASVLEGLLEEKKRKGPYTAKATPPDPEIGQAEAAFLAELEESIFTSSEDEFSGALFSPSLDEVSFFSEPEALADATLAEAAPTEPAQPIHIEPPLATFSPRVEAPTPPTTPLPSPPITGGGHSTLVSLHHDPAPIRSARPRPPRKAVLKPARVRRKSSEETAPPAQETSPARPLQRLTPIPQAFSESTPLPRTITRENELFEEAKHLPPEAETLPEETAPKTTSPAPEPLRDPEPIVAPIEPEQDEQDEAEEVHSGNRTWLLAGVALLLLSALGVAAFLLLSNPS